MNKIAPGVTLPAVAGGPLRGILRRVTAYSAVLALADFMFGAVYVSVLLARDLPPAQLGILFGISTAFSVLIEAPSGAVADKYGHRRLMSAGLLIWALALAILSVAATWALVLVGLLMWTAGMALQSGTTAPIVVASAPESDRVILFDVLMRRASVARWVGSSLGAGVVFALGDWVPGGVVIGIAAGVIAVLGLLVPLVFPSSTPQPELDMQSVFRSMLGWSRRREVVPLIIATIASGLSVTVIVVTWQPVLSPGLDLRLNGLLLMALTLAAAMGSLLSKALHEVDAAEMSLLAFAMIAAGLAISSLVAGGALVGYLLAEFGLGLSMVGIGKWQHLEFSDELRNTLYSTLATVGLCAALVANSALGILWQQVGLPVTVLVFAVAVAGLSVVVGTLRKLAPS